MSAIIKTLKTTTNDVEQSVYPKTVLEAVVDAETNETLDVILDNLNEKIDNIEPGGGGGSSEDRVIDYRNANIFSFNKETTSVTYNKCHLDLVEGKLYFDVTVIYTTPYPGSAITITINNSELYGMTRGYSIGWSNGGGFQMTSSNTIGGFGGSGTSYATHGYYGYYTIADTSKVGGDYTPNDILTKVQDSVDTGLNSSSINPVQNKAVKKALDDQRSSLNTSINSKVSKSGDTINGNLTVYGNIDNSTGKMIKTWDLEVNNSATIKGATTFSGSLTASAEDTIFQQGYYIHSFGGGMDEGYTKFATITITKEFMDEAITLVFNGRGINNRKLIMRFNGNPVSTAGLYAAYICDEQYWDITKEKFKLYLTNPSNGVFELYMNKGQNIECTITEMHFSNRARDLSNITWSNTFVTTLPSGASEIRHSNEWTGLNTATGTSFSLKLNAYSAYIISFYYSGGMSGIIFINPKNDGTPRIANSFVEGSISTSISGTTLTVSYNGTAGQTTYKYIELK